MTGKGIFQSFDRGMSWLGYTLYLLLLSSSAAMALPAVVTQEGVVMTADGAPVTGTMTCAYASETRDAALPFFDERHLGVDFSDGYYRLISARLTLSIR